MKISISLIAIFLICYVGAGAKLNDDFTKKYREEYNAGENTLLKIKNKFGDVNIEDWDKDQVIIEIVVTAKTESAEKAKKIFDRISISIENEENLISAVTEIDEKITYTGSKFQIDYSLKVPRYIKLDLKNKFGDVFINNLSGKVNINVSFGTLMINKLLNDKETALNKISLTHCKKASIAEVTKARIDIKYSKMEIINSNKLIIYSKYSKVFIDKVNTLISETAYDAYKLQEVRDFISIGKYCDYSIDKVTGNIDIEIKYGNFSVGYISPEFESIKSISKYAKVNLGISQNASYRIDAEVEYCGIDSPISDKLSRIKNGSETSLKGVVGRDGSPKSTVVISAKYGSVDLVNLD